MAAITPSNQPGPVSTRSKIEPRSAKSAKKVATVVEKTKPFHWTDQLTGELIKKYNDPNYLLDSEIKQHNLQLISKELNIPRRVCSSKIQVLKKRGVLKDLEVQGVRENREKQTSLQGSRIPFFLSNEEVQKGLAEIEICSSQIQVLRNQDVLKDLDLDASQQEREEVALQGSRIPFFLSQEEVERGLTEIENSFPSPFYSYNK
jgi:hypothetical protein